MITITEIGGNGYGSIEAKISDYYVTSLTNFTGDTKKSKIDGNTILARKIYFESLQLQIIEPNQNLSNGDVVEIAIMDNEQLAKNAKLKLKDKVFKYQVSYLPELQLFDPFEVFHVTFHGDNGEGYVSVENTVPLSTPINYAFYDSDGNPLESDYMEWEEESKGLSNGDVITLKLDYDESALVNEGYVIDQDEQTYTVSGLTEFEIVDEDILFDSFTYNFEGASPNASMTIDNNLPDDLYGYFDYYVSPDYDLKLGDKITITVEADQERLKSSGKILPGGYASYEYELTEDIIPQYLSTLDEISDIGKDDLQVDLSDYILKIQADYKSDYEYVKGDYVRLESVTIGDLEKVVLLYPKSSMIDQINDDVYSNMIFIYKAKVVTDQKLDDTKNHDLYIALVYSNLINYPGSGLYVDSSKLSHIEMFDNIAEIEDEAINQYRDAYTVTELSGSAFK